MLKEGHMKKPAIVKALCAACLVFSCVFAAVGCSGTGSGSSASGSSVAATVNGVEIKEADVTSQIEGIRKQLSLTDEDAWGQWLAENNYTPSSVREEVVNSLVSQELVKIGAADKGITVSDDDVNSYIQNVRNTYGSDDEWKSALETAGISEDQYRDNIKVALLQEKIMETFGSANVDDKTLLSYAQSYASYWNGAKRSSHILFSSSDKANAQSVLAQINSGEIDFATAAQRYSTDSTSAANGGDMGWDILNSYTNAYASALDVLAKDQVSSVVESTDGIHIIKCTDVLEVPETIASLDQLPSEFVTYLRDAAASSSQSTSYNQWLADVKGGATIDIKDMPSDVSYNVDMSKYQSSDASSASK